MKILSIGNSFSEDAQSWLHSIAELHGVDIQCANLYIGGCSLETHWINEKENNAFYAYQVNGNEALEKISISDALLREKWDVVTIQQVSNLSGMAETYEPYLSAILEKVRRVLPDAKLYLHRTWAYEVDTEHPGFDNYDRNQQKMYDCIVSATEQVAKATGLRIIPTGNVIQQLRENVSEFDYKNGGTSLCRDGYHLTYDIGRFAAGATWYATLTGQKLSLTEFGDFDKTLVSKIIETVNNLI